MSKAQQATRQNGTNCTMWYSSTRTEGSTRHIFTTGDHCQATRSISHRSASALLRSIPFRTTHGMTLWISFARHKPRNSGGCTRIAWKTLQAHFDGTHTQYTANQILYRCIHTRSFCTLGRLKKQTTYDIIINISFFFF
jgi:hypothetical protein